MSSAFGADLIVIIADQPYIQLLRQALRRAPVEVKPTPIWLAVSGFLKL